MLVEALVAMAMLAIVSAAILTAAADSAAAERHARESDTAMRDANAFMTAVSLWPREDLDRHLGTRREGAWTLEIQRPRLDLYAVKLTDSVGRRVLLATALYRSDSSAIGGVQ